MIFNSPEFVLFLVIAFTLYWLPLSSTGRHKHWVLLVASYVFYGWWDWRYLGLILFCSLIAFYCGLRIHQATTERVRKRTLLFSIMVPLAVLMVFKYYDFFVTSLAEGLAALHVHVDLLTLNVLLPVGISFYTFQALSYTTDIYRRQMEPTHDLVAFLAFKAFFPQLVAGPIERAPHFLPQILAKRAFSYDNAVDGCRLILIGAFKKMVVADRVGPLADAIFDHPMLFGGVFNMLGALFFAVQIYCDFSGYSDIAVGTAKLFNLDLMRNFNRPYLASSLRDFWSRWHISLSTWFRDYVYIPLGGNQGGSGRVARNLLITFVLSGLWHGANWTFVAWGALHGGFLLVERLFRGGFQRLPGWSRWGITMLVVLVGWVFFRAPDISSALLYLERAVTFDRDPAFLLKRLLTYAESTPTGLLCTLAFALLLLVMDLATARPRFLQRFHTAPALRYASYAGLVLIVLFFGVYADQKAFIYFQF